MKALVLMFAALAACGGASHGVAPLAPLGEPIALALPALDGGELEVARYRGQVVVLHVFTTGSLAAAADVDQLEAAATAKRAIVIGIALDLDGRALVAPWRTGSGVTYLVALADPRVRDGTSPLGAVTAVPMTIVLDRRGRPVARIERQLAAGELDTVIAGAAAP
ncbi:MAG TPA: TlpA disulfide reductase family protein [Kofleriaceae bacterium]|jgi:hypothetical protein|nr:TlpA disulfide reductase family protein [Kofleriaceae bacterium]